MEIDFDTDENPEEDPSLLLQSVLGYFNRGGPQLSTQRFDQPRHLFCRNVRKAGLGGRITLQELERGCGREPGSRCIQCRAWYKGIRLCIPETERSPQPSLPTFDKDNPTWSVAASSKPEDQRNLEFSNFEFTLRNGDNHIAYIEASLHECLTHHTYCASNTTSVLPTRVLDLEDPKIIKIRGLERQHGRYACLSHCWGLSSVERGFFTTKNTLKQYEELGIFLEALSKTFRDAMMVSRGLGIRYLWIDALCIIQGDPHDWRHEAAKMADIFRNSFITLAATSAGNSSEGCASSLSPQFWPCKLQENSFVRRKIPHFWTNTPGQDPDLDAVEMLLSISQGIQSTPLLQVLPDKVPLYFPLLNRGWVYQERLLSPRVVHFTANELVWECSEMTECQCRDQSFHEEWLPDSNSTPKIHPKIHHRLSLNSQGEFLFKRWRTMLEEYSTLNLTFQKDRLPALAGLAKQMSSLRPNDDYLAGVWRKTFFEDMLWTSFPGPSNRPEAWRAPTWSWASVQGSFCYRTNQLDVQIETFPQLLEAYCEPIGPDTMGELASGYIVARGQVIRSAVEQFGPLQSKLSTASSQFEFHDFYPDFKSQARQELGKRSLRVAKSTFCLRLARGTRRRKTTEYFLVLKAVDVGACIYERIGIAECCDSTILEFLNGMYEIMDIKVV